MKGEYIKFDEIKRATNIEDVANWLGLELKKNGSQLRGPCPRHGGERSLVLTPAMDRFTCFGVKPSHSGDVVELVAHVLELSQREAALTLHKHLWPQTELKELDYLVAEHPEVQALGLPAHVAKAIGAGFAPRGTMVSRVLLPLRKPDGTLIGYIGIGLDKDPILKLPTKFHV